MFCGYMFKFDFLIIPSTNNNKKMRIDNNVNLYAHMYMHTDYC